METIPINLIKKILLTKTQPGVPEHILSYIYPAINSWYIFESNIIRNSYPDQVLGIFTIGDYIYVAIMLYFSNDHVISGKLLDHFFVHNQLLFTPKNKSRLPSPLSIEVEEEVTDDLSLLEE